LNQLQAKVTINTNQELYIQSYPLKFEINNDPSSRNFGKKESFILGKDDSYISLGFKGAIVNQNVNLVAGTIWTGKIPAVSSGTLCLQPLPSRPSGTETCEESLNPSSRYFGSEIGKMIWNRWKFVY